MTREYSFKIGRGLENKIKTPIRNQLDIIKILLQTVQEIINPLSDTQVIIESAEIGNIDFRIVFPNKPGETLQRIFYHVNYPDKKGETMYTIQTMAFPFKIVDEDGEMKVFFRSRSHDIEFDSFKISQILAIINIIDDNEFTWGDTWVEELMELLFGERESIETIDIFYVVNDFLTFDFGYLRFDNDPEHSAINHPRYHIDTAMNKKATFKIGLHDLMDINQFTDFLNNSTTIKFIEK
ncbi:hypothetical protein ACTGYA_06710 [Streptococcus suis]